MVPSYVHAATQLLTTTTMAETSERDEQLDKRHYNLQSQIDHIRGFQNALADGIRGYSKAIEHLQAAVPKDPDRCAARNCGASSEIRVEGTIEVECVVGIPGAISLTISSFLCRNCWRAFTTAEADQRAEETSPTTDGQKLTAVPWGTLWQK